MAISITADSDDVLHKDNVDMLNEVRRLDISEQITTL